MRVEPISRGSAPVSEAEGRAPTRAIGRGGGAVAGFDTGGLAVVEDGINCRS